MSDVLNYPSESQDTLKTSATIPNDASGQDSLPRGSGLALKTIEMLSREIMQADSLDEAKGKAQAIQREVLELIKRQEKRAALRAA